MEAIILAGGVGSRLRSVIKDIPKPMALVNSKPFLEIILDNLNKSGFKKVILSVGYLSEIIIGYFGNNYKDIKISILNKTHQQRNKFYSTLANLVVSKSSETKKYYFFIIRLLG